MKYFFVQFFFVKKRIVTKFLMKRSLSIQFFFKKIYIVSPKNFWSKTNIGPKKVLSKNNFGQKNFWPKKNTSLEAPGALAHRLQGCTACKIQNGRQGAPKWPTGSGKWCTPRFLGAPVNFC